MKIELNGTLINGRIEGTDTFQITLRSADEEGRLTKTFSSELTFYDDGFNILKTALIDPANGYSQKVQVKVYDDCCFGDPVFEGYIYGDAIDWCEPGCYITANIVEEDEQINCVKSTIIWDNWNGFQNATRPIIRYCIETRPEFISYVLFWLQSIIIQIFNVIAFVVFPVLLVIVSVIYLVCYVIGLICDIPLIDCDAPSCDGAFNNPQEFIALFYDIREDISGLLVACGRFHPSPYVRDYIENVCQKCGLTFQSSILKNPASPYHKMVMTSAQVQKGRTKNSTNYSVIDNNLPVESLESYLVDYLKPMFNADYRVANGVLIFERKDFFQSTTTWIDTEQLLNDGKIIDDTICYNWIDKPRYAYGRFEYTRDAIDYVGTEANYRYNDIVEWNNPYNAGQSGELNRTLLSSPSRYREDGIDTDVYSFMANALGGIIDQLFGGVFSSFQKALLVNQHTFYNYKFMIYDDNGVVRNYYDDNFTGGSIYIAQDERFNYPLWFWEGRANNLYSLFHYIDDPRLPGATNFDFNFQFKFDCTTYKSFSFAKSVRLIQNGTIKNGIVSELTIDFKTRTMQVKGIV